MQPFGPGVPVSGDKDAPSPERAASHMRFISCFQKDKGSEWSLHWLFLNYLLIQNNMPRWHYFGVTYSDPLTCYAPDLSRKSQPEFQKGYGWGIGGRLGEADI